MPPINVTQGQVATASSYIVPYAPSRAVDGATTQPTSRWICTQLPGWLQVNLGGVFYLNSWSVTNLPTAGWPSNYVLSACQLQASTDGVHFNAVSGAPGAIPAGVQASFVRLVVDASQGLQANTGLASVLEFAVMGSTSNYLTSLALNGTPLTGFVKTTLNYQQSVPFATSTMTVTPTAEDTRAVIKVNGTVVASGQASAPISLTMGSVTNIAVVVSPVAGDPQTYGIAVTRADSLNLSSLVVKDNASNVLPLTPPFTPATLAYVVDVPFDSTATSVNLTPTREGATTTITVNGVAVASGLPSGPINIPAAGAKTDIPVVITGGGSAQTYTVSVVKASDPYLKSVAMSGFRMPAFVKTQYVYNLGNTTLASTTVTATADDPSASVVISLNGVNYTNGQTVPLTVGSNAINIKVTSAFGVDSRTYVFNINKTS